MTSDEQKLLIFTNSRTRLAQQHARRLLGARSPGRNAAQTRRRGRKPSSLMFAKFSPDGTRVGYVRENNIYVENLSGDGEITKLTTDGSRYIVNGTFDWVYEEELFCRDGFRWSPDSKHIAYWQLDSEGVRRCR